MNNSGESPISTIVLVHGLYQSSFIMKVLGRRLEKEGYTIIYFDYPTLRHDLSQNCRSFESFLKKISEPFAIISHSLGGLVTLNTLKAYMPQTLKKVIAITPPFHGSQIVRYLSSHHFGLLIGKSQSALQPGRQTLTWPFTIPLGVIAGTRALGPTSLLLEKLTNTIPEKKYPNDGTVYLKETQIEGITDFTTLDRSHTAILFDHRLPVLCDLFLKFNHFTPR